MAAIAQLGERQTEDLKVLGSIPGHGTVFVLIVRIYEMWKRPLEFAARSNGVTVSTLDFESSDGGSNPP